MNETANDGRPRTVEEFAALPEFGFGVRRHELTEADITNGYIAIDDRRVYVSGPNVRAVEIPAESDPPFVAHMLGDLEMYCDAEGVDWALTLRADGKWFKARM
jgi:hypothetical protein